MCSSDLTRVWIKKDGIFDFLCDRAKNDPCEDRDYWLNPRYLALGAIITHYPNHPNTLPLLRDRAENDPDEKLREFAKKQLQQWNEC